jgi:hypothetical protein
MIATTLKPTILPAGLPEDDSPLCLWQIMFWRIIFARIKTGLLILLSSFALVLCADELPRQWAELKAGDRTFHDVVLMQLTERGLVVRHRGGLAQIPFGDLDPDLRERFIRTLPETNLHSPPPTAPPSQTDNTVRPADWGRATPRGYADRILQRFGQPPAIYHELNLRPRLETLNLRSKNQGRRPSCAVFAVVSALEYQNALLFGQPESLSEEYLIWATLNSLGYSVGSGRLFDNNRELGFSLIEVVQALRSHGIALESDMPYVETPGFARVVSPPDAVVSAARTRNQASAFMVTGRSPRDQLEGVVHVINEGIPVVIGIAWPSDPRLGNKPLLDRQSVLADYAHAVTLVGYRCPTGQLEDAVFIFKNSYGEQWGDSGYGEVTAHYLLNHLKMALFLEYNR